MNRTEQYETDLTRLEALLRARAWTARELARELACSKPTAFARLEALERKRGLKLAVKTVRKGARGPCAVEFSLV